MPHVRRCHSAVQIQHFIVTKGGAFCDYGALRQALREVHGRVSVVREKLFRVRELEIDVAEHECACNGLTQDTASKTDFDRDRDHVKLARSMSELEETKLSLMERAEELALFYAIACALKDRIEEGGQTLTPARHAFLDGQMWVHRMRLDIDSDRRTTGKVSRGVMECVAALPPELRKLARQPIMQNWDYQLPPIENVMTGQEVIEYVANNSRERIGSSVAGDASASRVLEGVTG